MRFSDLERIVDNWERLENGCRIWNGAINGNGSPVINIDGQCRTVKSVLTRLLYPNGNRPTREVCHTEGCVHPRHYVRSRVNVTI